MMRKGNREVKIKWVNTATSFIKCPSEVHNMSLSGNNSPNENSLQVFESYYRLDRDGEKIYQYLNVCYAPVNGVLIF